MDGELFLALLFVASVGIGMLGSLAGVGGGVIFTPLFLAFTSANPDVIRATGLALAYTTSISAGARYLREGLANLRLVLLTSTFMAPAAILGAYLGLYITASMGETGAAIVRLSLGALLILIVLAMGVKRVEWPESSGDELSRRLGLAGTYFEKSLGREVSYAPRRVIHASAFLAGVGFISGMFGLGGGWALVPVYNLVMSLPLKVAVACSVTTLAIGDAPGLWVYIHSGAVMPPLLAIIVPGVMIGASAGSKLALRVRARVMRYVVMAVMLTSAIQLIYRGLAGIGLI